MAPRPGLEPGTYGLTVRTKKYLQALNCVATLYINQQLKQYLKVKALINIPQNGAKVATWWLHGNGV